MPELFQREVHCLLGLPFDAVDMEAALEKLRAAAESRTPCFLSTPNLNFLVAALDDPDFRDSVIDSDLSVADGMPIVWLARLLGLPLRERVPGAGLFEALKAGGGRRLAVFFFGGEDGVAERACWRLNAESGALECVGWDSPGFGSVEAISDGERLARISASRADFLVVALGARKGQAWIQKNRARLRIPLISHLGAVINHAAGTVRRAPPAMQRLGLEWLWRIREEPALWRRYWRDGMTLAGLFFTRVLPLLRQRRQSPPSAGELAAAKAVAMVLGDLAVLRLSGPWASANLDRLRRLLTDELLAGRDLRLDMQAVSQVDSACIGLLQLVHGHQRRQGRRFELGPLQPAVRRCLELHCAGYLCGETRYGKESAMATGKRTALILAALMGATSVGAMLARPSVRMADEGPRVALETMIPRQFGAWRLEPAARVEVVNPQTQALLDKLYSEIVTRSYVDDSGYRIMLSIAYGGDQREGLRAHQPEVCYPAQGFSLMKSEAHPLATPFGTIAARRMLATLGRRQEPVTYWQTIGNRSVDGGMEEKLAEMRFGLTGRIPDGLLFRISSVDPDRDHAWQAQERFVRDLLATLSPADRQRLSGLGQP